MILGVSDSADSALRTDFTLARDEMRNANTLSCSPCVLLPVH